jgi:hypothetical protein
MSYRYTPDAAAWLGFVAEGRALLVGGSLEGDLVNELWARLHAGAPALLELLTARGLQATPPFALVEPAEGGVRVIVRGEATVTVGAESISGAGAATWIERVLPEGSVELISAAADRAAVALPLVHGVARTSRIESLSGPHRHTPVTARATETPTARESSPDPAPAPNPDPAPAPSVASESTIVHEGLDAERDAPVTPPVAAAPSEAEAEAEGYDYLFGATMYRSVKDAAVEAAPVDGVDDAPVEHPSSTADDGLGDHDGETMFVSKIDRPRGRTKRSDGAPPPPVQASPVLVLPTGVKQQLDSPLVLGRAPSISGVPAGELPRLVPLAGGDQDLSRNHARVELQGGTVVVTDLHSKNGTTVTLPGSGPVRLRGGDPTPVIAGTVIELGGVVTVTIEDSL